MLTKANILSMEPTKHFTEYLLESSFQQTLPKRISCGEYNKTKQNKTVPMYCFGSTIMCTRLPKFSIDGVQKILPRPYFTLKPTQKGYKLIQRNWRQDFFEEVENHAQHIYSTTAQGISL